MPWSYSRDTRQLHMYSKMVEVQQVVEVLEEEADLAKYQDLLSVVDVAKRNSSEWDRYLRSSPGVETTGLRDQLFSCPDENMRTALY